MLNAAVDAMNSATADEAAYAAYMASQAAAEAKQLAAEQQFDYDLQEKAQSAIDKANEAAYAAVMAEEAEAAAKAQAEAEAAAKAAEEAAKAQQEADAAAAAAEEAARAQAEADAAAAAAQEAEQQAQQQGTADAQAEADAAAAAAAAAQEEADAAAQAQADAAAAAAQEAEQSSTTTDSASTSGTRQSVVNFALQFVGNPYVYGGTSLTNGADCSGFTQSVMANFGISIPRTAGAQSASGRAVSLSNIQPGDLLFYSGSGDYGIGHVTMYIGNGQVVHASTSRTGIIVSSIDYRTPCAARSYID